MIDPDLGYWIGTYTDLPNLVPLAIAADGLAAARLQDREWVRGARASSKPDEAITLVGSPGTAALIDTSRCIHYGSRGGSRRTLVIHWCSDAVKYSTRESEAYEDLNVVGR